MNTSAKARPPLKSLDEALAELLGYAAVSPVMEPVSTFDADGRVLALEKVNARQLSAADLQAGGA
ncbi:MAG: hypothetical protein CFE44_28320, partial [Burkholderiales bacterium PBB4]